MTGSKWPFVSSSPGSSSWPVVNDTRPRSLPRINLKIGHAAAVMVIYQGSMRSNKMSTACRKFEANGASCLRVSSRTYTGILATASVSACLMTPEQLGVNSHRVSSSSNLLRDSLPWSICSAILNAEPHNSFRIDSTFNTSNLSDPKSVASVVCTQQRSVIKEQTNTTLNMSCILG